MNDTLAAYLNREGADATTVHHAVSYAVAELADYLPEEEMREALLKAVGSRAELDAGIAILSTRSDTLLDVDLAVLGALWEEDDTRSVAKSAVREAKNRLPVVEIAIIALAAMYGMYLVATGGVRRRVRKTQLTKDGWIESEEVELSDFSAAAKALGGLIGRFSNDKKEGAEDGDDARQ